MNGEDIINEELLMENEQEGGMLMRKRHTAASRREKVLDVYNYGYVNPKGSEGEEEKRKILIVQNQIIESKGSTSKEPTPRMKLKAFEVDKEGNLVKNEPLVFGMHIKMKSQQDNKLKLFTNDGENPEEKEELKLIIGDKVRIRFGKMPDGGKEVEGIFDMTAFFFTRPNRKEGSLEKSASLLITKINPGLAGSSSDFQVGAVVDMHNLEILSKEYNNWSITNIGSDWYNNVNGVEEETMELLFGDGGVDETKEKHLHDVLRFRKNILEKAKRLEPKGVFQEDVKKIVSMQKLPVKDIEKMTFDTIKSPAQSVGQNSWLDRPHAEFGEPGGDDEAWSSGDPLNLGAVFGQGAGTRKKSRKSNKKSKRKSKKSGSRRK